MTDLSKTVEIIKENVYTKIALLEKSDKDLNFKLNESKQFINELASTTT